MTTKDAIVIFLGIMLATIAVVFDKINRGER